MKSGVSGAFQFPLGVLYVREASAVQSVRCSAVPYYSCTVFIAVSQFRTPVHRNVIRYVVHQSTRRNDYPDNIFTLTARCDRLSPDCYNRTSFSIFRPLEHSKAGANERSKSEGNGTNTQQKLGLRGTSATFDQRARRIRPYTASRVAFHSICGRFRQVMLS